MVPKAHCFSSFCHQRLVTKSTHTHTYHYPLEWKQVCKPSLYVEKIQYCYMYTTNNSKVRYSSTITSFFHVWPHMVTRKYSHVNLKISHGNLDLHEALRTTRHGMLQDVECHETSDVKCHKTCYVHGKSHGHRYSMSWACWLSTKKPMSTHTSYFLLHSWQHVSIANTEL